MNVNVLQNRYIAFLDILGFSERLARAPLAEIHAEYAALIDEAQTKAFDAKDTSGKPDINFAWARFVFDSLIVVSNDIDGPDAARNAFKFIAALVLLAEVSFARRLPLRGAIGRGDVLEDAQRGVILSPLFPQLLQAEKSFEWSGVVVLPAHADGLVSLLHLSSPAALPQMGSNFLIRYPAPVKGETTPVELWCVNWSHLMSDAELANGFAFLNQAKGDPTRAFVNFVGSLPAQGGSLPEKFRPATHLRVMIAVPGLRMKFADDAGNGVDPPEGATISLTFAVAAPAVNDAG
jgi:hypothetical protein